MRINESHETGRCEECGEMTYSDDPGRLMKDKHGNEKWVCQYCYDQLTPKKGKYDYVNVYTYENGKREYGKIGRQPYTNWFEVDVKDCPFKTKARVAKFAVDKFRKEHTKTNLWGNTWVEGGKPVAVKFYENGRFGKDFFRIRESFEKRGRMLKEDEDSYKRYTWIITECNENFEPESMVEDSQQEFDTFEEAYEDGLKYLKTYWNDGCYEMGVYGIDENEDIYDIGYVTSDHGEIKDYIKDYGQI